ncbi:hypothetical protein GYB22_11420 [bacterium]|nr:hypothetical protein [bacterium]
MSSGGHIADMVNRYRSNRKMLKHSSGNNFFNLRQSYKKTAEAHGFEIKALSDDELQQIREKVKAKVRKENLRKIGFLVVGLIVGLPITWFIIEAIALNSK